MSVFLERALRQARKFFAYFSRCRGLAGRGLVTTSLFMLWNMPLPHWSKVSHRHFVISFLSTHRTAFIPSINIQLRNLSLGERSPAFRGTSDIAETKEQVSDFSQCKTELTRTLNDCQPVKRCSVVSSLSARFAGPGEVVQF